MATESLEQLASNIQSLNREDLLQQLRDLQFDFPIDFSSEFLNNCSEEKLRHILLAAHLYARQRNKAG